MSALEAKGGGVEENLGSVSEGEGAVTKVLALLLVVEGLDGLALLLGALLEQVANDALGGVGADGVGKSEGDVGNEGDVPLGRLVVAAVHEVRDEGRDVVDKRRGGGELGGGVDGLDGADDDRGGKGGRLDLEGREVGAIALGLSDFAEGLDRFDDDTAGLGVGDSVLDLDEAGEELGEEGANSVLVVDKLGHVVLVSGTKKSAFKTGRPAREISGRTMMTATLRTVEVSFSVRPRWRRGAMRARVGESTSETKVVAARSWMVVGTSSTGLMRDEMRAGMNFSISLLETRAQSLVRDTRAAFLTSALVSVREGKKISACRAKPQRRARPEKKGRTPDGINHNGNDIGHEAGALVGRAHDELVDDAQGSGLDLPLAGGLDLL